ncbi:hypothetical protein A8F94_12945 [Bacillus sp. FJAT-27225]|nr:hypothetical protein A8F94_12945 [Bacillus sp. FJAT-27225]
MIMIFPSKKDKWMGFGIWWVLVLVGWLFFESLFNEFDIFGMVISVIMIVLSLSLWFNTFYGIGEETLTIKYGPFTKLIKIEEIRFIRFARNPFTAPALSIERI